MIASLDFGDLNITSQEDDILDEDEALAGKYKCDTGGYNNIICIAFKGVTLHRRLYSHPRPGSK